MITNISDAMRQPPAPPPGQSDIEDDQNLGHVPSNDTKRLTVAADRLRSLVDRIERIAQEKQEAADAITDLYKEVSSAGFVPAVVRQLVAERKKAAAEVREHADLLDIYRKALEE